MTPRLQSSVEGTVNRLTLLATRLAVTVVAGALVCSSLVVAMAPVAWGALNANTKVPVRLGQFAGLAQRSVIFDVNGEQIGVFQVENTQRTPVSAVPEPVVAAFLAVEDSMFFNHKGVNLRATVRALLANYQSSSTRQGASTITQQVVKNEFLAGLDRDGRYKILQARYAVMLEEQVPKEQILERYLNTVFFGNNAYGLQAAAEVYFGKPVSDLSLLEGAFLAGMVQAPSSYDPIRRPDASRTRYKVVLSRLVDVGLLEPAEATRACTGWETPRIRTIDDADCPIPERANSIPQQEVNRTYFTEEVRDYLLNRSDALGATYEDRFARLYRGGLRIYTTLDRRAQIAAETAAAEQMPVNSTGIQAAAVVIDNASGGIRAMVGGSGFVPGRNEVNLAVRRRQTGSSIKMFILAAALQAGVLPDDVIDGTLPCTLPNPGKPEEPFAITKGVSRATSSLRIMTALSINCAYARLSQVVGLERTVATIYRMIDSEWTNVETFAIQPYASLATGANELSPLDMASGAQSIANEGVHLRPYMIERIDDANGEIFRHVPEDGTEVLPRDVALRAVDTLKGVLDFGTARRSALDDGRPAGGKTGTQDNNTNAWFVGFTKQYSAAVWVGDPKGYTPMVNIPEFVEQDGIRRVQGAMYPARIWKAFMEPIHADLPAVDWDQAAAAVSTGLRPDVSPQRIYLPGEECLARVVSGVLPGDTATTTTTSTTTTTTTTIAPEGAVAPPVPVVPPTAAPPVVVSIVDPGTTIAPTDTNPYSPVNTVPIGQYLVYSCAAPLPPWVATTIGG